MVKKKSNAQEEHNKPSDNDNTDKQEVKTEKEGKEKVVKEDNSTNDSEKQLQDLTVKLTEMQDKYLRLSAEFDNYRKRTLREKIDLTKSAGESVIVSFLPVVDDFDRAMASLRNSEDCPAIKEGLKLIYGKIYDFLAQNGVKEMDVVNTPFDSEIHEAVTNVPVDDESKKGTVIDVISKGYILNEKVIRYPKVVVGE